MREKIKTADARKYHREYKREWHKRHPGHAPNTDESITKVCTKCGETKPATADYFSKEKTRPLGIGSRCKPCSSKKSSAYNAIHRDRVNELARKCRKKNERKYTLRYRHGMTIEEYDAILNAQGGVCAICGALPEDNRKKRLAVDHDHETGANRGLLCPVCNHALERVESIPDWCDKAISYLTKYEIGKREKEFSNMKQKKV